MGESGSGSTPGKGASAQGRAGSSIDHLSGSKKHRGGVIIKPWVSIIVAVASGRPYRPRMWLKRGGKKGIIKPQFYTNPDGNRIRQRTDAEDADGLQTVTKPSVHTTPRILAGALHLPRFDYLRRVDSMIPA